MKFAHLADCHIGGWREEEMKELSIRGFEKAIEISIQQQVEFIIIAGDLFNTSLPSIEALKRTTSALKKAKDEKIPIYLIPGSHDYSPSRKTMLDVLEKAGLCTNVFKYQETQHNNETKHSKESQNTNQQKKENQQEQNKKTKLLFTTHTTKTGEQIKLTGIAGLAGGTEKEKYESLENKQELENAQGFKIFLFHTLLTELKPKSSDWENISSEPLSLLPKNFNYYAGGHPHFISQKSTPTHSLIAYPGPTSPNNFKEIEELKQGGFYILEKKQDNKLHSTHIPLNLKSTLPLKFNADNKTPQDLQNEITNTLESQTTKDSIITLRIAGILKSGKTSDINFKKIFELYQDSYIILKNTSKLKTKEFEEIKTTTETDSTEEIEDIIIKEHLGKIELPDIIKDEEQATTQLMIALDKEKNEGEKNTDFETRLIQDLIKMFNLEPSFELTKNNY